MSTTDEDAGAAAAASSPPRLDVGSRILHGSQPCTVLFRGSPSAPGEWLGVEWDDPTRGRHSGEKDGVQWFICRVAGAGSFVRPTSTKITFPRSFLSVLQERYSFKQGTKEAESVELQQPQGSSTRLMLGQSGIAVDAPNLGKVRERLGRVRDLREIGLDREGVGLLSDDDVRILDEMGPWKLRSLNMAKSLLPSWDVVALIVARFEQLESLSLNENRFARLDSPPASLSALAPFARLKRLSINGCLLDWSEIEALAPSLPSLESLEAHSNRISTARSTSRTPTIFPRLSRLKLDNNAFEDWSALDALSRLPSLRSLSLSSNALPSITSPHSSTALPLPPHLEVLSIANNSISSWETFDVLAQALPDLKSLIANGNPLFADLPSSAIRLALVARFPSLVLLESSEIVASDRLDAERYFLKIYPTCAQEAPGRKRWDELVKKHGLPDDPAASTKNAAGALAPGAKPSLRDQLISLTVHPAAPADVFVLRVLPSLPLSSLRKKISVKIKPPSSSDSVLAVGPKMVDAVPLGGSGGLDERRKLAELDVVEGSDIWIMP